MFSAIAGGAVAGCNGGQTSSLQLCHVLVSKQEGVISIKSSKRAVLDAKARNKTLISLHVSPLILLFDGSLLTNKKCINLPYFLNVNTVDANQFD